MDVRVRKLFKHKDLRQFERGNKEGHKAAIWPNALRGSVHFSQGI